MTLSPQSLTEVRFSGRLDKHAKPVPDRACQTEKYTPLDYEILTDAERQFVATAFAHSGLAVADYRARPLRRRIAAALRAARVSEIDECLPTLQTDRLFAEKILTSLLIGYTLPFRDEAVFCRLHKDVLPQLLANRSGLRIWSVACSNGAELYSAAMLLANLGCLAQSILRGTDSRKVAIIEAQQHLKTFWESIPSNFADLKQGISEKEFKEQAGKIDWQVENIFSSTVKSGFEIVLCRNLAIYLQPLAAKKLWETVAQALVPGGILVTGKAEKPLPGGLWQRIDNCIYQKVEKW
jgi:chemotaxis methyl-accepting protein methylase